MVLLVMSLAVGGVVELPLAFALVLGANVGGAISPIFVTLAAPAAARRVPLGNLAMRAAGCLLVLPFLSELTPYLAMLEEAPARQVVNFHTAFNLALALLFLPLIDLLALALARLLPPERGGDETARPRYLDDGALDTPSVAIASAARETLRMGDVVEQMLSRSIDVFRRNDAKLAREVEAMDDVVDRLHESIKLYLTRITRQEMEEAESRRYVEVLTFTTNLEHIGDIIDKNLMELANKKIRNLLAFSDAGFAEIAAFHAHVVENMRLAFNVFMSGDVKLARKLLAVKVEMRGAEQRSAERHLDRVREGRPESIETSSLHQDVIRDLRRINNHLTSVAYPILEAAGELSESRLRGAAAVAPNGEHQPKELPGGSGRVAG
jgi:phosphate:Na+ symporter